VTHLDTYSGTAFNVPTDLQEDTDLQKDKCQGLNDDVTTTVSSKRLWKPPITRKDGFFMDGHQQNKTRIGMRVDNKTDLNSSQILILQQNVQSLKINYQS
jgi:hypothetical protein